MRNELRIVKVHVFVSEVDPDVETESDAQAKMIAWADDEHPEVYPLIKSAKSTVYGRNANAYHGWARGSMSPGAILHRLEVFLDDFQNPNLFWKQRAAFALRHQNDPGFTGAIFQQHAMWSDGKEYSRSATFLDYTPETREEVLDRFQAWMDPTYENVTRITIDGEDARRFGHVKDGAFVASPRKMVASEARKKKRGTRTTTEGM